MSLASRLFVFSAACLLLVQSVEGQEVKFRDLVRKYTKTKTPAAAQEIAQKLQTEQITGVVALEYKVLLVGDGGKETVIDTTDHEFSVGDQIRVQIEPLQDVYIYIFHEGASGEQVCLLPDETESIPVAEAGKAINLPDNGHFEFQNPPGEEKLIVVATEKPATNLNALQKVVFKKPDEELSPEEKKIKEQLKAQVKKTLQSMQSKQLKNIRFRGLLSDKALAKLGAQKKKNTSQATLEEPPTKDKDASFAMSASLEKDREPQLYVNIPLKSISNK
jgi:hypothetical protein